MQKTFKFEHEPDFAAESFIISACNIDAANAITNPIWPFYALSIFGPEKCGKTHICGLAPHGTVIIEDVNESVSPVQLLAQLNTAREQEKKVLITSTKPLATLNFALPDLQSRLSAIPSFGILQPDDNFVYLLFARYFKQSQLKVSDEVINYLTSRTERSYSAIYETVKKIDELSLQDKKNITVPLCNKLFQS
jgi:chromosomal replication initiation ATPase DnaA